MTESQTGACGRSKLQKLSSADVFLQLPGVGIRFPLRAIGLLEGFSALHSAMDAICFSVPTLSFSIRCGLNAFRNRLDQIWIRRISHTAFRDAMNAPAILQQ